MKYVRNKKTNETWPVEDIVVITDTSYSVSDPIKIVWHPGTKTYMALEECVIVDVPDGVEDIEEYLDSLETRGD